MLNVVVLMGRLAQTPEIKKGKNGEEFTTTSLAVQTGVNPDGSDKVMFVNLTAFYEVQKAFDYLDKGDQVAIRGRLDTYSFTKKDGTTGYDCRILVDSVEFGAKKQAKEEAAPVKEETKQENTRRTRK